MAYRMLLATPLAAALVPAWGAEAPEGLPEALRREVPAAITLPAGRYTAAKVWEAEAPDFGHHVGRAVEDPDAEGGKAWEALVPSAVTPPVEQTSQREIRVEDLPKGEYRSFPLVFRHPGGPLETRVQWSGSAAIAIDTITAWRLGD